MGPAFLSLFSIRCVARFYLYIVNRQLAMQVVIFNSSLMINDLNDEVSDTCMPACSQQAIPQRTKVCNK